MKKIITLGLTLMMALTSTAQDWKEVTDASDLKAGDQIVLGYASKGKVAGKKISGTSSKYIDGVDATIVDGIITNLPDSAAIFTLSGDSTAWTLTVAEGAVLGATGTKKLAWNSFISVILARHRE